MAVIAISVDCVEYALNGPIICDFRMNMQNKNSEIDKCWYIHTELSASFLFEVRCGLRNARMLHGPHAPFVNTLPSEHINWVTKLRVNKSKKIQDSTQVSQIKQGALLKRCLTLSF